MVVNHKDKMTKNCIEPWRSFQFEAGGNITPCCSGTITGNFGNIIADHFDALAEGRQSDLFANPDYRALRNGLLTGELSSVCRTCRSVHDADITPEELRQKVIHHLESQGIATEGVELECEYAFFEVGGNITNKCNFSCVYCSHSGINGHIGYFAREMERESFLGLIDLLCRRGLSIFNFCGIGELTIFTGWRELCEELLTRHPQLRLRVISNFGKELSDAELDTLSRFDLIHVSCDTLEADHHAWLRKGGRLPVLLENIRRLRERFSGDPARDPKLVFNVTVTDVIVERLEGLFRFAADNSMFVHLSNLFVMEGSIASSTDCVRKISDIGSDRMPHIREILTDLPLRMKAQNPVTNVWEYRFLYHDISRRADAITLHRFVPAANEPIYDLIYRSQPRNQNAFLKKIWLSFDQAIKGVFIAAGADLNLSLPVAGKMVYRTHWCRERLDGNVELVSGSIQEIMVGKELTVSTTNCAPRYDHIQCEIISFEAVPGIAGNAKTLLIPVSPAELENAPLLVREAFLTHSDDVVAQRLVASQEPVVIWCAGLRTLQLLSGTCLGKANIRMIIDGNPARKGQQFCGFTIHSPEDLGHFDGIILVIHSSSPEQVEQQIRRLGINNQICTL